MNTGAETVEEGTSAEVVEIQNFLLIQNIFRPEVDVAFSLSARAPQLDLYSRYTCPGTTISTTFSTAKAKTMLKELVRFVYLVREAGYFLDESSLSSDNISLTSHYNVKFKRVWARKIGDSRRELPVINSDFKALSDFIQTNIFLIEVGNSALEASNIPWDVKSLLSMLKTSSTNKKFKVLVYHHYAFMDDSLKIAFLTLPYYDYQNGVLTYVDLGTLARDMFGSDYTWVDHVKTSLSGSPFELVYETGKRSSWEEKKGAEFFMFLRHFIEHATDHKSSRVSWKYTRGDVPKMIECAFLKYFPKLPYSLVQNNFITKKRLGEFVPWDVQNLSW